MQPKKKTMKKLLIFVSVMIIVVIAASLSYIYYDAHSQYNGIDVSHHNNIDWESVAGDPNIKFCYIKATEGINYTDPKCLDNVECAKAIGIDYGLYHYFRTGRSGIEQFRHFDALLQKSNSTLIPVVDIEAQSNSFDGPANTDVKDFLAAFYDKYGYYPIVYYGDIFSALRTKSATDGCQYWSGILFSKYVLNTCIQQQGVRYIHNCLLDIDYCEDLEKLKQ